MPEVPLIPDVPLIPEVPSNPTAPDKFIVQFEYVPEPTALVILTDNPPGPPTGYAATTPTI